MFDMKVLLSQSAWRSTMCERELYSGIIVDSHFCPFRGIVVRLSFTCRGNWTRNFEVQRREHAVAMPPRRLRYRRFCVRHDPAPFMALTVAH